MGYMYYFIKIQFSVLQIKKSNYEFLGIYRLTFDVGVLQTIPHKNRTISNI